MKYYCVIVYLGCSGEHCSHLVWCRPNVDFVVDESLDRRYHVIGGEFLTIMPGDTFAKNEDPVAVVLLLPAYCETWLLLNSLCSVVGDYRVD